jgi:two-component system, NtrC family, nitrogen regulation response regulator NtrX
MNILIIDDEKNIADSLAWILRKDGHSVQTADCGEAGLSALTDDSFDLVFLDVIMPGMGGLATLEKMVVNRQACSVIMISGHADLSLAVQATKLGAYDFLEKPLNAEKIIVTVKNLAEQMQARSELLRLKEWVDDAHVMIGGTAVMQELHQMIDRTAPTDSRILIHGENGTGKELVAHLIHRKSLRSNKSFLQLNCAALPRDLIESELFGYEKGAFTGAYQKKIGLIEQAQGGTLLLDEIADMSLETQAKLLRVLQENTFTRVGGSMPIKFDVRFLSATNKDMPIEIEQGRFRQDLYYRLNVIPIRVPPLRERTADLSELSRHFLVMYCRRNGKKIKILQPLAEKRLVEYAWPGNVRELRNIMERLAIMLDVTEIDESALMRVLPQHADAGFVQNIVAGESFSLKEQMNRFEKNVLRQGLTECGGNISRLAERLQTDRANLYKKLKQYGLKK